MGEHNRPINCPWCRSSHGRRFLCDAAKAYLDATIAKGEANNMPTTEFEEFVAGGPLGGGQLVQQLVVQAALIEAGGVHHPALVFGARGLTAPLQNWVYPGRDEDLRAAARLVHDITEMVIRRANVANGGRRG